MFEAVECSKIVSEMVKGYEREFMSQLSDQMNALVERKIISFRSGEPVITVDRDNKLFVSNAVELVPNDYPLMQKLEERVKVLMEENYKMKSLIQQLMEIAK